MITVICITMIWFIMIFLQYMIVKHWKIFINSLNLIKLNSNRTSMINLYFHCPPIFITSCSFDCNSFNFVAALNCHIKKHMMKEIFSERYLTWCNSWCFCLNSFYYSIIIYFFNILISDVYLYIFLCLSEAFRTI